ncbi:uncharacterized protein LOC129594980 isoform X2 [Paramacrobiotus metropolitanus]|uniref:uncharacterized protein LOC129594980 isoform X2 n=1 Tax=Paramacrobiotus metropolitanus TaxID=2943436 RepID=UPI0024456A72|nr:uncharacterized protein LOC129594980 isoform X2 [Paramacrobiotus metropolitanus]
MQRLLPKPSPNGVPSANVPLPQTASLTLPTFILVPITPGPPPLQDNRHNRHVTRAAKKRGLQSLRVGGATKNKFPRIDEPVREASVAADENCSDSNQCRRCVDVGDEPCVLHSRLISDTATVARAYGSLPSQLYIAQKEGMSDPGVFAKRAIPHQSVFGPLLAPFSPHPVASVLVDHRFGLRQKNGPHGENADVRVFDLKSDDLCNWIKFVREAVDAQQQNLVAFQQDDRVYLATTKDIPAETELCFWYSTKYCQFLNKENLQPGFAAQENNDAYGDVTADSHIPMDALCSVTPTAATGDDSDVIKNALPAVDPSPARSPGPRRRRVITVDTAVRPCYLWFRTEERCLVDWFVNPDNCRLWKRAGRKAMDGSPSKLHVAGVISSYLVENGCESIGPEIIKRKVAALETKALQPETDKMPAYVRRFREAYNAVNLSDGAADDNHITNLLPDTAPTGLMALAAHRPPRKGRPTGWSSMEERWLVEWFAQPDNCQQWKTSFLHHTENDIAKSIAAYLLERGGQNFSERPPLNILRKIRLLKLNYRSRWRPMRRRMLFPCSARRTTLPSLTKTKPVRWTKTQRVWGRDIRGR